MSLIERALQRVRESGAMPDAPRPAALASTADARSRGTMRARVRRAPAVAHASPARIVHVDREALRAARMLPPEREDARFARQYRRIKWPLLAATGDGASPPLPDANLIMVASALAGEGKTFTALNLALSLARERDTHVTLVDADVAKPHLTELLALRGEPGLGDALASAALDAATLVLPTDVPRLSVLPAGTADEDGGTETLSGVRLREVAAQLASPREDDARRIVVFDSSPVLETTDSRVLATVVGQVVFVVRALATPRAAVAEAIASLGTERPLGVLLNQVPREPAVGYYYGYGADTHEDAPASDGAGFVTDAEARAT